MKTEYPTLLPDLPHLHLVPSHFPLIDLFESEADPNELETVYAIEAPTNDQLREEAGGLWRVPHAERVSGPDFSPEMAVFTNIGIPSRFTDGAYRVYYGARDLGTAIAETVFHRERLLAATHELDAKLNMRQYVNRVALSMHECGTIRRCMIRTPSFPKQ